ncbi:type IV secretion system protein [Brevundimonas sp. BAL450]|uniref:type IV secretion system protein n=1 Tax=Brevundimonas sp. BAL450 TaxID=1708162 RepID=UPI0018CA6EB2|nr:type IV secretion system protein [Brevundimonas sp. BAL450]MBG7614672.1 type IV secretion system protein [Brevundimonas sp. BAL450]
MIRHSLAAASAVAALLLAAGAAQAQMVVHDPTSYAQLVREAQTALQQLEQLREQVRQGEALFDSLNDVSDINRVAQALGLPEVRSPLPDLQALRAAAEGDLSALGALAERADAIRADMRLYTPPAGDVPAADRYYHEALERAGARTARDLAVGEAVGAAADQRLEGLEVLRQALDTAPNARAVMDLEARLAAEQALIQNEQVRLQGLAMTQAAEERLEAQRARERAAAARDDRLATYRQAIQ